jgi:hypothetical protein
VEKAADAAAKEEMEERRALVVMDNGDATQSPTPSLYPPSSKRPDLTKPGGWEADATDKEAWAVAKKSCKERQSEKIE